MKRLLYIITGVFCVLVLFIVIVKANITGVTSYITGKIAGGKAAVGKVDVRYDGGIIAMDMSRIRIDGSVAGAIGTCKIKIDPWHWFRINEIKIADFDITVVEEKKESGALPCPRGFWRSDGAVTFQKEKFVINEIRIGNLSQGEPSISG
jgi:hypothetical protein